MKTLLAVLLLVSARASATPIEEARQFLKKSDYTKAVPILEAEATRGSAEGRRRLCELYGNGYGVPKNCVRALELCRQADAAGDALAAQIVMNAYYFGRGIEKSTTTAAKLLPRVNELLMKCAERGDVACMSHLAFNYDYGYVGEKNPSKAIYWAEKQIAAQRASAESGGPYEQFILGSTLLYAPRTLQDVTGARAFMKKSSDAGYPPAMIKLADMMIDGQGGPKDESAGVELYRRAAEAGYAYAYGSLAAVARKKGDTATVLDWLRKAAETNAGYATMVADLYAAGGPGLDKDSDEAMRWAYRAAKSGETYAMEILARAYAHGEGVSKDGAEAVKWSVLAARNGSYSVDRELKEFSAGQITEGRKRAAAFQFVAYAAPKPLNVLGASVTDAPTPKADVSAAPAVSRLPERKSDFALVVGIEKYKALPAADYAENDAAAMRDRLIALGFPERNIVMLIGADATRSKLQAYLDEWLPRNATKDGRVFFYFLGHGSPDAKTGQAFLVPSDGDPAFLKSTAYPLKDLYAALDALPSRQVVAAIDSCFSGAGGRSVLAKGMRPLVSTVDVSARKGSERLVVLTASAGDQTTGGLDTEGRGAFTYYLLKGLEGGALDDKGRITAGGLNGFLSPKVADSARRQNREQTPMLFGDPGAVLFELPKKNAP